MRGHIVDAMHYILTFPAYGTWLPGPARGMTIDIDGDYLVLPMPDRFETARRRDALKWPIIELNEVQRSIVSRDLDRVAAIRNFTLHDVIVAPDCVHIRFSCPPDTNVIRLVQFMKGAPARALSIAIGDPAALSNDNRTLIHHKWWSRQYRLQRLSLPSQVDRAEVLLRKRREARSASEGSKGNHTS
ncbi:MAG: transposase [Planctomycetota bacterium]|nr:transposase [Planctomycetota bacterium]